MCLKMGYRGQIREQSQYRLAWCWSGYAYKAYFNSKGDRHPHTHAQLSREICVSNSACNLSQ